MDMHKENIRKLAQAVIICNKTETIDKMADICYHLTSDCGAHVTTEIYPDNIVRYLIVGTRCQTTVCYNTETLTKARKKRGAVPLKSSYDSCFLDDILNEIKSERR